MRGGATRPIATRGSPGSAVAIWARTTTKKKVPPLADYLIAAEVEATRPPPRPNRLRAAMHVLSAQYGLPLRERTK